jgi:MFS family permease
MTISKTSFSKKDFIKGKKLSYSGFPVLILIISFVLPSSIKLLLLTGNYADGFGRIFIGKVVGLFAFILSCCFAQNYFSSYALMTLNLNLNSCFKGELAKLIEIRQGK